MGDRIAPATPFFPALARDRALMMILNLPKKGEGSLEDSIDFFDGGAG
jgi:hypothetical protein